MRARNATAAYAVIGQPVAHSLSPAIHRSFAHAAGHEVDYSALEVAPSEFFSFALKTTLQGINVTLPLKQLAWRFACQKTGRADQAGAVNTLTRLAQGRYAGDNTDGAGLLRDLTVNLRLPVAAARILVIGAGGATRGILGPLLATGPQRIVIANRTAARAVQLAALWGDTVAGCGLDKGELQGRFDAIIHASAAGHQQFPRLPDGLLEAGGWCYDLSYGAAAQPFLQWARQAGCGSRHDGLGMLVEQAAESFSQWHGHRPATVDVLRQLRNQENNE